MSGQKAKASDFISRARFAKRKSGFFMPPR